MSKATRFFTDEEKQQIVDEIIAAEKNTIGEIKVHIENTCKGDELVAAKKCFSRLGMHKTKNRTGILIYLALNDRKLAIIGDKGIDELVPMGFWEKVKDHLIADFKQEAYVKGIVDAVKETGVILHQFFPADDQQNPNELSDEISFGEN